MPDNKQLISIHNITNDNKKLYGYFVIQLKDPS